jgi:hypothetical protein
MGGEETSNTGTPVRSSGDSVRNESNGAVNENEAVSPIVAPTVPVVVPPIQMESPAPETEETPGTETPDIAVTIQDEPSPSLSITNDTSEVMKTEVAKPEISPPKPTTPAPSEPAPTSPRPASRTTTIPPDTDPAIADLISQLRGDLETCESRRIEELQQSSERISSLETKLKILSKSTADASQELASDTSANSWERKLADREGKIALLLDEGFPLLI